MQYDHPHLDPVGTHHQAIQLVRPGDRVLELGAGPGRFTRLLWERGAEVVVVDKDRRAIQKARRYACTAYVEDLTDLECATWAGPEYAGYFSAVYLLDVIEHIAWPGRLLEAIRPVLAENGRLVVSVPNIAYAGMRFALLAGRFDYEERGILDRTHLRFFTRKTLLSLLAKAGYATVEVKVCPGVLPYWGIFRAPPLRRLSAAIAGALPTLLAYQFLAIAEPRVRGNRSSHVTPVHLSAEAPPLPRGRANVSQPASPSPWEHARQPAGERLKARGLVRPDR